MESAGGLMVLYKLDKERQFAEHVATGLYWQVNDENGPLEVSCQEVWVRTRALRPPLVAVFFAGSMLYIGVGAGLPECDEPGAPREDGFVPGAWKMGLVKFWSPIPPVSEKAWVKTVVQDKALGAGLAALVARAEKSSGGPEGLVPTKVEAEPQKL